MQAVRKSLIATASVGALLAVVGATPAQAALIEFTFNPNGSVGPISSNPSSAFTANDLTIADYANIVITNGLGGTASATESAILDVTGANNAGSPPTPVLTPGLNGGTGPYQLYFSVTATATATLVSPGVYNGSFTSISYQLIGATGVTCAFSAGSFGSGAASVTGCGTTEVLASGTLVPGQVSGIGVLGATNYVSTSPTEAGAIVTIAQGAGAGNFFVAPLGSQLTGFEFITDFTNNVSNVLFQLTGNGEDVLINGGGGNINMLAAPVPEPLTLSLFGAGLAGAAALRRRRSKKA